MSQRKCECIVSPPHICPIILCTSAHIGGSIPTVRGLDGMPRVEYRIFDLPDKPRPIVINLDFSEVRACLFWICV